MERNFVIKDLFFSVNFENKMNAPECYKDLKKTFPNKVGFFQMGDWYECYAADAMRVAEICDLEICVTSRQQKPCVTCGFPRWKVEAIAYKCFKGGITEIAVLDELK